MPKNGNPIFVLLLIGFGHTAAWAQLTVDEIGQLPVRLANNAVCEGFDGDTAYLFSFGGIDSTKKYSGIHRKCYRVNLMTNKAQRIPNLPDDRGKIASAASRIGDIIYITGGYYVYPTGREESSSKIHRYQISANEFLSDGSPIPIATDDHVQAVWRDSLIYVITGWKDSKNIPNVQIYDPVNDGWQVGSPVPNTSEYTSFGASGVIIEDTIYYFGGAASIQSFPIQSELRKGVIDPKDPTKIEWSIAKEGPMVGYRMAATTVDGIPHWVGGSEQTYNFDGIAYKDGVGVEPAGRDLWLTKDKRWEMNRNNALPMDLRGIAKRDAYNQYIAGGMLKDQQVTNKVLHLQWDANSIDERQRASIVTVFPNPFENGISVRCPFQPERIVLWSMNGRSLKEIHHPSTDLYISLGNYPLGTYFLQVVGKETSSIQRVVRR